MCCGLLVAVVMPGQYQVVITNDKIVNLLFVLSHFTEICGCCLLFKQPVKTQAVFNSTAERMLVISMKPYYHSCCDDFCIGLELPLIPLNFFWLHFATAIPTLC